MWRRFYRFNKNNNYKFNHTSSLKTSTHKWKLYATLGCVAGITSSLFFYGYQEGRSEEVLIKTFDDIAGKFIEGLPTYTPKDVAQHKTKETRIWVSFKEGVYDITEFIERHPGGDKILLGVGGSLEPFWAMYQVHKHPNVAAMLEEFRIGNLTVPVGQVIDSNDPYAYDPVRHVALKVNTNKPFNAETPNEILVDNYITPNEFFFVRNHLPVPVVDINNYKLVVTGEGLRNVELSLEDLKTKFKKHTVTSSIQCAGNRRSAMSEVKPVQGLNWGVGAIGNASWSGCKLRDVLIYAGLTEDKTNIEHVQFEGLDRDFERFYGASIPVAKAMNEYDDVILAYEMNGETLPIDHGYPVRVVVPGTVGARNVKWLCKVNASHKESESHWQQKDYKGFGPYTDWSNIDYSTAPAIQELPVQSAILQPTQDKTIKLSETDEIVVRGYAWSGGGRGIVRVDISMDGGLTWQPAELEPTGQNPPRAWGWTIWQKTLKLPANPGNLQLVCKAVDSSYNVQPDTFGPIWNVRGVLSTAWHRVNIKVEE